MSSPCPPPANRIGRGARRHSSCSVCKIRDGDTVLVVPKGATPVAGEVRSLSPAGITLTIGDARQFFPWTSVICLQWDEIGPAKRS